MDDVKTQDIQAEPVPAEQPQETVEQTDNTPETPVVSPEIKAQERTVPLSVVQEERKKRQELQRELAELRSAEQFNQYPQEDLENILQHPMVQEMILKEAKRELTDYARETLEQYPGLHPQVKNAIVKNARGFVNENTTDIETAKIDLQEYIESLAQEVEQEPMQPAPAKGHQMAVTNVPATNQVAGNPADVQAILNKSVDSWTDEETSLVEAYSRKTQK